MSDSVQKFYLDQESFGEKEKTEEKYSQDVINIKEILKRESTGLQPKIELICQPKDFYSHTIEDFKFSGLEGIEKLSNNLEIAILTL